MNSHGAPFTGLEQAVLKTVAFFDVFDYPLTAIEVHKWLYQPDQRYSLLEILVALSSDSLATQLETKNGFYFLIGRAHTTTIRLERYQIAEKKFYIALRAARFLRYIAFVELVAVCNNVGYNNGSAESDIDFFIVAKSGRLWWARLLVTTATTLLGIRRHGIKIVDRVCLSFYTADSRLNLFDIALAPDDPYLVYWFATLAPIYDSGTTYQTFLSKNTWLQAYLPHFHATTLSDRRRITDTPLAVFSKTLDRKILTGGTGAFFERLAKRLERVRMQRYLGDSLGEHNSNVVVTDDMLKLHKTDRREIFKQRWHERLTQMGIV